MFAIGYGATYFECNHRKGIDQIIEFKKSVSENPCNKLDVQGKTWIFLWSYLTDTTKEDCINYMKKQGKIDTDWCLPHHVLIEFTSDIYSLIFENIFLSTFSTFNKITKSSGWIEKICIAAVFVTVIYLLFPVIIGKIIQSSFRYGFGNLLGVNQAPQIETRTSRSDTNDEVTVRLARVLETLLNQNQNNLRGERNNVTENRIEDVNKDECMNKDTNDGCDEFEYVEVNDNEVPIEDKLITETVDTKIDQSKKEMMTPLEETIVKPQ